MLYRGYAQLQGARPVFERASLFRQTPRIASELARRFPCLVSPACNVLVRPRLLQMAKDYASCACGPERYSVTAQSLHCFSIIQLISAIMSMFLIFLNIISYISSPAIILLVTSAVLVMDPSCKRDDACKFRAVAILNITAAAFMLLMCLILLPLVGAKIWINYGFYYVLVNSLFYAFGAVLARTAKNELEGMKEDPSIPISSPMSKSEETGDGDLGLREVASSRLRKSRSRRRFSSFLKTRARPTCSIGWLAKGRRP